MKPEILVDLYRSIVDRVDDDIIWQHEILTIEIPYPE